MYLIAFNAGYYLKHREVGCTRLTCVRDDAQVFASADDVVNAIGHLNPDLRREAIITPR